MASLTNPNGMQSLGLFNEDIELMHLVKPGFGPAFGLDSSTSSRKVCMYEKLQSLLSRYVELSYGWPASHAPFVLVLVGELELFARCLTPWSMRFRAMKIREFIIL